MWLFAAWLVAFLASSLAVGLAGVRLTDEIEAGVPIAQRPSWRGWNVKRLPWVEFEQHRKLYPESRLRVWFLTLAAVQSGLLATLLLAVLFHPFGIAQ